MKWTDHIENGRLLAVTRNSAGRIIGKVLPVPITYGRKIKRTCYPFYANGMYGGANSFAEAKELVEYIAPRRRG